MGGLQTAKGSAEAATSPSRGSNNPGEDHEMNRSNDSTEKRAAASAEGVPAFPGYQEAFEDLESPVGRLRSLVELQAWLTFYAIESICDGDISVNETVARHLVFVAGEMDTAAAVLESTWLKHHNAGCAAAHGRPSR